MKPFHGNIEEQTLKNENFRKVVHTGKYGQLVLMSLPKGCDIGTETHFNVDQFFRIESGIGKAIVNGEEFELSDGVVLFVNAGSKHNLINTGEKPLKLYTIYSPPNHIDGRVHPTKEDAIADKEDEEFGHGSE